MKIFSFRNIPICLHPSFLMLAVVGVAYSWIHEGLPAAITVCIMGTMLFTSVLLHEIGHASMARAFNISTRSITLYPFGGIALIEREPDSGSQEFFVALAGPAVNFIIACIAMPITLLEHQVAPWLLWMNILMGIFNLIPAYPMDGGRILRSWLSGRMGKTKATKLSLNVSLVFAFTFLGIGIIFRWLGLTLVGIFLLYAVNQEKKRHVKSA